MPDYDVIAGSNFSELRKIVIDHLRRGYACQGGVCVITLPDGSPRYYQAVVRPATPPPLGTETR